MASTVDIGQGKSARRGYRLRDVAIVPTRRTRSSADVSTTWQIDAFGFDLPMVAHPSDSTMSPKTVVEVTRLGGLGVLDGEGLWARYEDPESLLTSVWPGSGSEDVDVSELTRRLQEMYAEPVKPDLLAE